jgi:hypothetical protein
MHLTLTTKIDKTPIMSSHLKTRKSELRFKPTSSILAWGRRICKQRGRLAKIRYTPEKEG